MSIKATLKKFVKLIHAPRDFPAASGSTEIRREGARAQAYASHFQG